MAEENTSNSQSDNSDVLQQEPGRKSMRNVWWFVGLSIVCELLTTLKDANESMRIMNQRSLREMDNISANLAGHLSVLIDECVENYDISLKVWIKSRIQQLADMRELTVNGVKMYISFPVAVAQLSPYLLKTRMHDETLATRLLPIRKAIRTLAEMS